MICIVGETARAQLLSGGSAAARPNARAAGAMMRAASIELLFAPGYRGALLDEIKRANQVLPSLR